MSTLNLNTYIHTPSILSLMHKCFRNSTDFCCCLCRKTHECHHGWKATTRKRNNQTKPNQNLLHLWVHVMAVAPTLPIVTWAG